MNLDFVVKIKDAIKDGIIPANLLPNELWIQGPNGVDILVGDWMDALAEKIPGLTSVSDNKMHYIMGMYYIGLLEKGISKED